MGSISVLQEAFFKERTLLTYYEPFLSGDSTIIKNAFFKNEMLRNRSHLVSAIKNVLSVGRGCYKK
ncbi:MAG: hypothetical protein EAZ60_21070 [Oscillatoriales cyanobacterium]|nr:MAG: hypothetical protein EAZ83_16055 [Oscillatoriales cyanobacterium]TAE93414.1 MAG: hypothetical protein EAZ79_27635 [Oscillatoriales cyanobacterium]TAF18649.1 MAG: hypothetical protein EAZ73_17485 [Oscillatoriales cyanobacterium]TAF33386.1 MAG: hypothetical protein EAZ69_16265 [Oscillatoriales cyanobacterium]TAF53208.1 MAG: hypothetical protein EAZ60_21070 [Oscillatoriales cyanobacterium]